MQTVDSNFMSPVQREAFDRVVAHTTRLLDDPARRERANIRVNNALYRDLLEEYDFEVEDPPEHATPEDQIAFELARKFMSLISMVEAVRQVEYYFRRYPFRGLPVSRNDHLRNSCEMYFDRVVQFRDRLKATLNAFKSSGIIEKADVTRLIRAFDKAYDWELRRRNSVHHSDRFDDAMISQLSLAELLHPSIPEPLARLTSPRRIYRKAVRDWVRVVRERTAGLSTFADEAAKLLTKSPFFPPAESREEADPGSRLG